MFFTILDSKKECLGYYYDGAIHEELPGNIEKSITWDYKHHHHIDGAEYLSLYCNGRKLSELCPPHLHDEMVSLREKKQAYAKVIRSSKINLSDVCIYDMIPDWFLREYSQVNCEIMQEVYKKYERPESYEFTLELEKLFGDIESNVLNMDLSVLTPIRQQVAVRNLLKRVATRKTIKYNQFGTKTGRLTVTEDSFPILNLKHSYRGILKPNNDLFVEFDYNAAELRTLLALAGVEQPQEDVHEWNMHNVFDNISREEAKKRVFSWLYNPNCTDRALDRVYNRRKVLNQHWDGEKVITPFGRQIEAQEHYALNYIIQSTTNDLVLKQVLKVKKLLEGKKSKIVFLIHDSFVLDLDKNETALVSQIAEIFSRNNFGDFMVNVKAGKDFGSMKEINK